MKKQILKPSTICDICGKNETYGKECLKCGKDFCYDCSKSHGVEYAHAVNFSGSWDGFYCNECDTELQLKPSNLWSAYRKIAALRSERDAFYFDFKQRSAAAENHLKAVQNLPPGDLNTGYIDPP